MDLPIFELKLKDDESGIKAVALVDFPAIGVNYQTFKDASKTKFDFQVTDEEERVIMGAAMIPNLPIYRRDETHGEYYAVFTKETIKDLVQKFFKESRQSEFNEMHSPFAKTEGVSMFQSFITSEKMGISAPKGFENIADGSWFIAAKVENEEIWNKIKEDGGYKGFSIEGFFDMVPFEDNNSVDAVFAELKRLTEKYFEEK